MVCRNTPAAELTCALIFAPGSYKIQSGAHIAMFRIRRDNRTLVHGTLRLEHGRIVLGSLRGLRRGRYTLIISTGSGRHADVLLRRTFTVS